jgi:hypothetical protein
VNTTGGTGVAAPPLNRDDELADGLKKGGRKANPAIDPAAADGYIAKSVHHQLTYWLKRPKDSLEPPGDWFDPRGQETHPARR